MQNLDTEIFDIVRVEVSDLLLISLQIAYIDAAGVVDDILSEDMESGLGRLISHSNSSIIIQHRIASRRFSI